MVGGLKDNFAEVAVLWELWSMGSQTDMALVTFRCFLYVGYGRCVSRTDIILILLPLVAVRAGRRCSWTWRRQSGRSTSMRRARWSPRSILVSGDTVEYGRVRLQDYWRLNNIEEAYLLLTYFSCLINVSAELYLWRIGSRSDFR